MKTDFSKKIKKALMTLTIMLGIGGALFGQTYRLDYEIKSDTRKNYIVKEILMYYHARAGAIFSASPGAAGGQEFRLTEIPEVGSRVRTHRNGEKISIVTAGKTLEAAKAPFEKLENEFKTGVSFYGPLVKTVDARPFLIGGIGPGAFGFSLSPSGAYREVRVNLPMIKPEGYSDYGDSFNVYPLMGEVLNLFGQDALPSGGVVSLAQGQKWYSAAVNLTPVLNRLLALADHKATSLVSFRQSKAYRVEYQVSEKTANTITISGRAAPNVEIASGVRIRTVSRTLVYELTKGELVSDRFSINARDEKGIGWSFAGELKKI